jgi:hypothetical protein
MSLALNGLSSSWSSFLTVELLPALSIVAKLKGFYSVFFVEFIMLGLKGFSAIFLSKGLALNIRSSVSVFSFSALSNLGFERLNSIN